MPWLLFTSVIIAVVVGLIWLSMRNSGDEDVRAASPVPLFLGGAIVLLLMVLACTTIVNTRNVGVVTQLGKPVKTLDNGFHLKFPWDKVHEMDGTVQTDIRNGGWNQHGGCENANVVRLASNTTACVASTVRWRIALEHADTLYRDYKDGVDKIRDSLVSRELEAAVNAVFVGYNPLLLDRDGNPQAANLAQYGTDIKTKMEGPLVGKVVIESVIITAVHYDGRTQDNINLLSAQAAQSRVAQESQKTATAQAEANRIAAASVDINVLIQRCLELVNAGKPLPAGFQCFPGNTAPLGTRVN